MSTLRRYRCPNCGKKRDLAGDLSEEFLVCSKCLHVFRGGWGPLDPTGIAPGSFDAAYPWEAQEFAPEVGSKRTPWNWSAILGWGLSWAFLLLIALLWLSGVVPPEWALAALMGAGVLLVLYMVGDTVFTRLVWKPFLRERFSHLLISVEYEALRMRQRLEGEVKLVAKRPLNEVSRQLVLELQAKVVEHTGGEGGSRVRVWRPIATSVPLVTKETYSVPANSSLRVPFAVVAPSLPATGSKPPGLMKRMFGEDISNAKSLSQADLFRRYQVRFEIKVDATGIKFRSSEQKTLLVSA